MRLVEGRVLEFGWSSPEDWRREGWQLGFGWSIRLQCSKCSDFAGQSVHSETKKQ